MQNTNFKISKTPVIIVSGFLGAGKTTFIQKLVSTCYTGKKVVILENEFGVVDFDGALLQQKGFEVVSVQNGCICCTGVGDFTASIQTAIDTLQPDILVIEPTGVARLSDVLKQFSVPPLLHICALSQVITVADTRNFEQRLLISEDFYENQLQSSNVIVLSKTESMKADAVTAVTQSIHQMSPKSLIIVKPWELLSPDEREVALRFQKEQAGHKTHVPHNEHEHHNHGNDHDHHGHDHNHSHDDGFLSLSFDTTATLTLLQEELENIRDGTYGSVLRIKGTLPNDEGVIHTVDYVPHELKTELADASFEHQTFVTVIGIGLNLHTLQKLFGSKVIRDES